MHTLTRYAISLDGLTANVNHSRHVTITAMIVAAAKIGAGERNQVVPKVVTVAISVAPQEVLCPSKATGTPSTLKCSSPSMMTQS